MEPEYYKEKIRIRVLHQIISAVSRITGCYTFPMGE